MIRTDRTNKPSHHIRKRSEKMRVEQIAPGEFRVIPEPGKAIRIVKFHIDGADVAIECYDEKTKVCCEGNAHARLCAHVNAAIKMLLNESDGKSS